MAQRSKSVHKKLNGSRTAPQQIAARTPPTTCPCENPRRRIISEWGTACPTHRPDRDWTRIPEGIQTGSGTLREGAWPPIATTDYTEKVGRARRAPVPFVPHQARGRAAPPRTRSAHFTSSADPDKSHLDPTKTLTEFIGYKVFV